MDTRPRRDPSPTGLDLDPLAAAFRALAEEDERGVIVLAADKAVRYANAAARLLLGAPDAPDDGSDRPLPLPDELRSRTPGDGEIELDVAPPDASSGRSVRATPRELTGADGAVLWVLEDRASALAERASLELASRLRAWSLFRVVHNLKQPLNVLSLQLELLKAPSDASGATSAPADSAAKAQNEVLRFGRELDALAALLAPPARPASEPFDVVPVLAALARRVAPGLQAARVQLDVELPAQPLLARATPRCVEQAVLNVLQNAVEATPRGGAVALRARARDGTVEVAIEDRGTGMAPEVLARAFERHYSTRSDATGIGLPVARWLLEREGGRIELSSRPGTGTTAVITLPHG